MKDESKSERCVCCPDSLDVKVSGGVDWERRPTLFWCSDFKSFSVEDSTEAILCFIWWTEKSVLLMFCIPMREAELWNFQFESRFLPEYFGLQKECGILWRVSHSFRVMKPCYGMQVECFIGIYPFSSFTTKASVSIIVSHEKRQ